MPRKLGKFGQKMHKNLYMSNLFNLWNYIAKNIFFTANIGRGETQTFHIPKWISCEGSVAFTQNIPQGSEVYRPDSGCMKPCRNGVINKKETIRMIFLEYPNVLSVRGQKNGWMSIRFSMKTVILRRIIRRLRSERTGMDGAGSSLMNVAQGAVAE